MRILACIAVAAVLVSCAPEKAQPGGSAATATASPPQRAGLGTVMGDVARRFEIAGRAAAANRFELAEFEAGEIGERFETDVPNAELPKEGPTAHIHPMAKAFLETNARDLQKAAASKDLKTFEAAFQRTSAACNACHKASEKGFIEIPSVLGKAVPDVDPVPAAHVP
jgi:hypothetical protein